MEPVTHDPRVDLHRYDFAPNSVWQFRLPDSARLNADLAAMIRRERAAVPVSRVCAGRNMWQSQRQVSDEPPVREVFTYIFQAARQVADFLDWDVDGLEPRVQVCWANIHHQGSYHTRHIHPATTQLSGTYYVEAPPGCGDIVFHDLSRFLGLWGAAPKTRRVNAHTRAQYSISPEPGLCVLFPAYLVHEVEVNAAGGDRLGLAFNINFEASGEASGP